MAKRHKPGEGDFDTAATEQRCTNDLRLRRHGFRIKARPKVGPVLWERLSGERWVECTEAQAHKYADVHEKAVAECS